MPGIGTPATALLEKQRVAHRVLTYDHDPKAGSYGLEAAEQLGLSPELVFKTLVAEVDGILTVGVVPVTAQLDLKALAKARSGKKAVLAEPAKAQRTTGYVAGGISPLGQRRSLPTVLDSSADRFEMIYCSGGRRGLEIEIAPETLRQLVNARLADIATA